jgi:hypothetical protein
VDDPAVADLIEGLVDDLCRLAHDGDKVTGVTG